MTESKIHQAVDKYLDWLSDQPEAYIRRIYANRRIPRNVDFNWEIGGTEYIVTSHFNQSASEDIFNKLGRILENDIAD